MTPPPPTINPKPTTRSRPPRPIRRLGRESTVSSLRPTTPPRRCPGVAEGHPDLAHDALGVLPPARELRHGLELASAYRAVAGAEPSYTNVAAGFTGVLDYVWCSASHVRPLAVVAVPREDALARAGAALPNAQYSSDHLLLCCDLQVGSLDLSLSSSCFILFLSVPCTCSVALPLALLPISPLFAPLRPPPPPVVRPRLWFAQLGGTVNPHPQGMQGNHPGGHQEHHGHAAQGSGPARASGGAQHPPPLPPLPPPPPMGTQDFPTLAPSSQTKKRDGRR